MNEDEYDVKIPGMRDKEAEERQAQLHLKAPVFMYRLGESRKFESAASVPDGEGWVDSPAKVRPMSQIQPVEAVLASAAPIIAEETPPAVEPPKRRGRPPRNGDAT